MEGPCDNLIVEELTEEDLETCEVVCQPANVTECAKLVSGSDEDGNEIWEDDPENCVELEKTECKVQEIKDVLTDEVTNDEEPSVITSKIDIAEEESTQDSNTTSSPTTSTTEELEDIGIEDGEEGQDTVEITTEELSENKTNTTTQTAMASVVPTSITTQTAMTSVVPSNKTRVENEASNNKDSAGITTTMDPTEGTTISAATTTSDKTASTPEEVKNDASAIVFD